MIGWLVGWFIDPSVRYIVHKCRIDPHSCKLTLVDAEETMAFTASDFEVLVKLVGILSSTSAQFNSIRLVGNVELDYFYCRNCAVADLIDLQSKCVNSMLVNL